MLCALTDADDVHHAKEADVKDEAVQGKGEREGTDDLKGAEGAEQRGARVHADEEVDEEQGEHGQL